jgi:hypothetical protein
VSALYKTYFGIQIADANQITANFNNINESTVQNILTSLNGYTIRNNNLIARDDIPYTFFKKNSMCSYRAYRYSGCYPICYDSDKLKDNYDGRTVSGKELLPSNDLQLNFLCNVSNLLTQTYTQAYTHTLYHVQIRVFYAKGGEFFTTKV